MPEHKHKLGDAIDVGKNAPVVRPDGREVTVSGGSYVLDEVGTFVVDGTEVVVK